MEKLGYVKVKEALRLTTEERLFQYFCVDMEMNAKLRYPACSALSGQQITNSMVLLDLERFGLGMWNATTMGFVRQVSRISQDYYPETMGQMIICNAPFVFKWVYSMCKGWVDEATLKKIKVFSSVDDAYDEMIQYIDHNQIPAAFGGGNHAPSPADIGPWNDFEIVNSVGDPDYVCGVRHRDDPEDKVFTPIDCLELPNPWVDGPGLMGSHGAVILQQDGSYLPNRE